MEPETEKAFSALDKKIVSGRFFNSSDSGIILSERLSKHLAINVGDSLVLLSQGYQGVSANGIFKIIGIVRLTAPELDNQMAFMPLKLAQDFYSMPNRLTSVVIDIKDPQKMNKIVRQISRVTDKDKYEVMSWEEMLVELYQQWVSDEGGGVIMLGLLYLIVGFGVLGTVLMMISERRHELAVMVTVGMQRQRLMKLVGTELFYVCFLGVIFGIAGSLPVVAYYHFYPIQLTGNLAEVYAAFGMDPVLPVAWRSDYIIQQAVNVGCIIVVALIYPMYSVYKLDLTKALRR